MKLPKKIRCWIEIKKIRFLLWRDRNKTVVPICMSCGSVATKKVCLSAGSPHVVCEEHYNELQEWINKNNKDSLISIGTP